MWKLIESEKVPEIHLSRRKLHNSEWENHCDGKRFDRRDDSWRILIKRNLNGISNREHLFSSITFPLLSTPATITLSSRYLVTILRVWYLKLSLICKMKFLFAKIFRSITLSGRKKYLREFSLLTFFCPILLLNFFFCKCGFICKFILLGIFYSSGAKSLNLIDNSSDLWQSVNCDHLK